MFLSRKTEAATGTAMWLSQKTTHQYNMKKVKISYIQAYRNHLSQMMPLLSEKNIMPHIGLSYCKVVQHSNVLTVEKELYETRQILIRL